MKIQSPWALRFMRPWRFIGSRAEFSSPGALPDF
jgi:hypothetical protein